VAVTPAARARAPSRLAGMAVRGDFAVFEQRVGFVNPYTTSDLQGNPALRETGQRPRRKSAVVADGGSCQVRPSI
jgi:hypothetical protein